MATGVPPHKAAVSRHKATAAGPRGCTRSAGVLTAGGSTGCVGDGGVAGFSGGVTRVSRSCQAMPDVTADWARAAFQRPAAQSCLSILPVRTMLGYKSPARNATRGADLSDA